MMNNNVLRSVRYMLDLSEPKIIEIAQLANSGLTVDRAQVQAALKREGENGYVPCPDTLLAHFLDGLIVYCRGRDESTPLRPVEARVTNNLVLKKLRVAFQLKDIDIQALFEMVGFPVSKPELSALFRLPEHKHYRVCGDQRLRHFLKGLTMRVRPTP